MSQPVISAIAGDPELRRAVAAIARHWRRRRIVEGAPAIVAAAIVAVLAGVALRSTLGAPGIVVVTIRVVGYILLAIAAVWFVLLPALRRVSDEQVALYIEEQAPDLRQLFLSAVQQLHDPDPVGASPALRHRVVQRALVEIQRLEDGAVIERPRVLRATARLGALALAGVLLVALGPSRVREVTRVLFVPWSRAAAATVPALSVAPGDVSVPRGGALDVRAELRAAADRGAEIVLRGDSADSWTRVPMVHDSTGAAFVARLFDINRNTTYYVEAGAMRSPQYHITVTDLPTVRQLALELRYPAYTGLAPQRIENGGDVVAVTGTTVVLDIAATLPVSGGALHFDDGTDVLLTLRDDGHLTGAFKVAHDGFYRVDMVASDGTRVPGTVQHSVEALIDHPPLVRIDKPGRDTRVTSIEEVPISVRASDDYGVRAVELHYTVNGGADHVVPLVDSTHKTSVDFSAVHTVFLEEMSLHVGDLVAYHAIARDGAANVASSDIYFMEVRAFGKDYHAADDNGGGGGGGGGGNNPGKFTERQRQLVAGTFNWQRDSTRTSDRDRRANATTLAIAQGKLRTDVAAQSGQMQARGAVRDDSTFTIVIAELDSAATEMKPAEDGLGRHVMRDAIPAEERALQHLQAADEAYRDITVRQQQGGGGGGGGGGSTPQDLADLFELQTDKLKNQYEAPRTDPSNPVQQALDSAQEKLKELAERQLQENERQRQAADSLADRMGQQGGGNAGGGQTGRQGSGTQPPRSGAQQLSRQPSGGGATGSAQRELARQVEEQARQLEKLSRDQNSAELADAARKLQEAADAMRQAAAGSRQQGNTALDRLRQATQNVTGAESSAQGEAIQDLSRRASELGIRQQGIANDVAGLQAVPPADKEQRAGALDRRKDALADAVKQLGADAQRVAQEVRRDQPKAAAAVQTAADEIRDRQLAEQISQSKRIMRSNMAEYSQGLEHLIGETLDTVAHRLAAAAGSVGTRGDQQQTAALDRTRELVRDLQSLRDRTTGASGSQPGRPQGQPAAPAESGRGQQPGQGRGQGAPGGRGASPNGAPASGGSTLNDGGGSTGIGDPRQFQREVAARTAAAEGLRKQLAGEGVDVAPLNLAIEQLRRLQETTNPGNADELQAAIVAGLKEFEFNVWRKFAGADLGNKPALGASAQVPPEFRAMVEQYYRSLARKGPD
jgi:Domain of unknown function (DUF4175)